MTPGEMGVMGVMDTTGLRPGIWRDGKVKAVREGWCIDGVTGVMDSINCSLDTVGQLCWKEVGSWRHSGLCVSDVVDMDR